MHESRVLRISAISAILFAALFIVIFRRSEFSLFAHSTSSSAPVAKDQNLIDAYRHVEVAWVSDAQEQHTGRSMYMSHKMQPIFPAKFAGFALTVKLQKDEANRDPAALNGMLAAIDQGALNSVWVMVVEDGVNIAGMGGLMNRNVVARIFRRGDRRWRSRSRTAPQDWVSGICAGRRALHLGSPLPFRGLQRSSGL